MSAIQPIPSTFAITDSSGRATVYGKRFFDDILTRVGGVAGGILNVLPVTQGAIIWNLEVAPTALVTLGNGANILSVLNQVAGFLNGYRLTVIQPSSGAAGTITWPKPPMLFPGGAAPVLSAANNAIDEFWFSSDGTNLKLCVEAINFS